MKTTEAFRLELIRVVVGYLETPTSSKILKEATELEKYLYYENGRVTPDFSPLLQGEALPQESLPK